MIDTNDFKNLNEFHDKLVTTFPRIKDIHYTCFIERLEDALELDLQKDIYKRLMYTYVKGLYRRCSNDEMLNPYIPTSDASNMINITKTLIDSNTHYFFINQLFQDAIDYLLNNRINYRNCFKTTTRYLNAPIFPEKENPAFEGFKKGLKPQYYGLNAEKYLFDEVIFAHASSGKKIGNVINMENIDNGLLATVKFDETYKRFMNAFFGKKEREEMNKIPYRFMIEKVIFNDPATIVYWADGNKTVVKCQNGETFDPEKGLAMAISKRALGDCHEYYEAFKKHVGKYYKQEMKKSSAKIADMVINNEPQAEINKAIEESKDIIDKKPKKGKK